MEKIRTPRSAPSDLQIPGTETDIPASVPTADLSKHFRGGRLPEWTDSTDFHRGSRSGGVGHALMAWSFMAALIDSLILFSLGCTFLFTLSFLVKVQAFSLVGVMAQDFVAIGVLGGLSLICAYMIMLRVFLGFTIGEWACGLRLGSLKQRLNRTYGLRVIARTFLVMATGLFLFPALSLLTGRDLQGLIVRLPLIQIRD